MQIDLVVHGAAAPAFLQSSLAALEPRLRDVVDSLPGRLREVASYHLGWLGETEEHTAPARGGKRLRGALALASAEAAGGDVETALPAALAVELVHNYSLLHDDVMDRDEMRRDRPAAWVVFGEANAILAGNVLLSLAFECVSLAGPEAVGMLTRSVVDMCLGQSQDLGVERRTDVHLDDCLGLAQRKTGELLAVSCALGAMSAGAASEVVTGLRRYGERTGLAFQLSDDVLGIWGDSLVTGKPAGTDLAKRKLSLPVAAALSFQSAAATELASLYFAAAEEAVSVERLASLVDAAGGRAWAEQQAAAQLDDALAALEVISHASAVPLRELARYVVARDR